MLSLLLTTQIKWMNFKKLFIFKIIVCRTVWTLPLLFSSHHSFLSSSYLLNLIQASIAVRASYTAVSKMMLWFNPWWIFIHHAWSLWQIQRLWCSSLKKLMSVVFIINIAKEWSSTSDTQVIWWLYIFRLTFRSVKRSVDFLRQCSGLWSSRTLMRYLKLLIIATWVACHASVVYQVRLQCKWWREDWALVYQVRLQCKQWRESWAQGRKLKTAHPKSSGASGQLWSLTSMQFYVHISCTCVSYGFVSFY